MSPSTPGDAPCSEPLNDGQPVVPPRVAGNEAKTPGVLSSPTTPVPSIIENQVAAPVPNDKPSWSPASVAAAAAAVVPVRPKGPSLLTQQLAEARGMLPLATGQSLDDPSHSALCPQHSSCDPAFASLPNPQTTHHDLERRDESDDSSLTPRASPRALAMATTTTAAVSTLSLPPRVSAPSELAHMDMFGSNGRTCSPERADSQHDVGTVAPTQNGRQAHQAFEDSSATDDRSAARPRKPDHRVSMGPEKVWSIGSDDLNNDQDGQVEKSIAEVLAGVEPNARSRKASHSLRFFKEGLPEEKLKRRDSRLAPRDKFLLADDATLDRPRGDQQARSLQPSPGLAEEMPGRFTRTRTFPLQSTDSQHHDVEAPDYFQAHPRDRGHATPQPPLQGETVVADKDPIANYPTIEEEDDEEEAHEGGHEVAVEDAELSGEEKISSAVFVPHKGLQGVPESPVEEEEVFDALSKPPQRSEDGASWLVKADEPEADEPDTPVVDAEDTTTHDATNHRLGNGHLKNGAEPPPSQPPAVLPEINIDHDFAPQGSFISSQLASPGFEEHVHDHQTAPEQPLDAIELIPYRHQVGGHTTLWRFSKRAVCKQLNNRENEFYENIERYHRDLLPFLPRYVPQGTIAGDLAMIILMST